MDVKYLEIKSAPGYGFAMRIFYGERLGVITVTNIHLQSTVYGAGTVFPGGEIKVDGETILTMDYNSPATHAFSVWGPSASWLEIETMGGGTPFPVSSKAITNKTNVTLSANILLYKSGMSARPELSGSVSVPLTLGLVYIKDDEDHKPYEVDIHDGTEFKRHLQYVHDGNDWTLCG